MRKFELRKRGEFLECISHKPGRDGYPRGRVDGKLDRVHRHVFRIHKGEIPEGLIIRHTCDNRLCCNPDHLILGTTKDNARDRVERGRGAVGERNGRSKLTNRKVKEIRALLASGITVSIISTTFGISQSTVRGIKDGSRWGRV